jgi:hypothetical protein
MVPLRAACRTWVVGGARQTANCPAAVAIGVDGCGRAGVLGWGWRGDWRCEMCVVGPVWGRVCGWGCTSMSVLYDNVCVSCVSCVSCVTSFPLGFKYQLWALLLRLLQDSVRPGGGILAAAAAAVQCFGCLCRCPQGHSAYGPVLVSPPTFLQVWSDCYRGSSRSLKEARSEAT